MRSLKTICTRAITMAKKAAKKPKNHPKRTPKPMKTYVIHYIAFGVIVVAFIGTLFALHSVDKADILGAKSVRVQTKNPSTTSTSFNKTGKKDIDAILQTLLLENTNDNSVMNETDEKNTMNTETTSLQKAANSIDGN